MRATDKQIGYFVKSIFHELEDKKLISYESPKAEVFKKAVALIQGNFDEERRLDEEVNAVMDHLEQEQNESFERAKMFPMLKRKLAEKKGFIL